jgi:hypothetical protein
VETGRGKVKKELPYKKLDAEKDLSFLDNVVDKVQKEYHNDDRELQMVSA